MLQGNNSAIRKRRASHRTTKRAARLKSWLASGATAILAGALLVPLSAAQAQAATPSVHRVTSVGTSTWQVPAGVNTVHLTVVGAGGGNTGGGSGGTVSGTYDVSNVQSLQLYVAGRGDDGAYGGGGDSGGVSGWGYRHGGHGGSANRPQQGGGGGGGASAVTVGSTAIAIAAGGGGGGGEASCFGNPGGNAGSPGIKTPPAGGACASHGGDPGSAGATSNGHGANGIDAGSGLLRAGGGGGGGGLRGGGGGDRSGDGGGGGGGGTFRCSLTGCSTSGLGSWGNGFIEIRPVHTPVVAFDEATYSAHSGNPITLSGTVTTRHSSGGIPTGNVQLTAVNSSGDTEQLATVPVQSNGSFAYDCTATCGLTMQGIDTIRAEYRSSNTSHWTHAQGTAPLAFINGETQTALFIDPQSAVLGEMREFTATVSAVQPATGTLTGDVEFWMSRTDGSEPSLIGTSPLAANHQTTLEAGVPVTGTHRFWAVYPGITGFNGSQSPRITLTTSPAHTQTTAITVPSETVTGQPFEVEATVIALAPGSGTPTGTVRVTGEHGTYTGELGSTGSGLIQIDGHEPQEHTFTVEYLGDGNYLPSETTVIHTVNRSATDLTLAIDEATSQYGDPVTLTATAATIAPGVGQVTGEIEFGVLEDGEFVPLGDPVKLDDGNGDGDDSTAEYTAEYTVELLDAGSHEFQARYPGSSDSLPAVSNLVEHEVTSAQAVVALELDRDAVTFNRDAIADITVAVDGADSAPVTGNVELYLVDPSDERGTEPVASGALHDGTVQLSIPGLEPGEYTLVAVYLGSSNVAAEVSESAELTVIPATTEITVDGPNNIVEGETGSFTAEVTTYEVVDPEEPPATPALAGLFRTATVYPGVWQPFAAPGEVQFFVNGEPYGDPVPLSEGDTETAPGASVATIDATLEAGEHEVEAHYLGSTIATPAESAPHRVAVSAVPDEPATPDGSTKPDAPSASRGLAVTGGNTPNGMLLIGGLLIIIGGVTLTRRFAAR